ncbi:sigma-70 family RNA polymerase sigma factor [Nicoliella spurrieriana]|uniref:Sigma-70 family RNA polymerase sigma factor n=1 Tax=Nicoliella spurrieriana TaxID=2925830 RepID=A0A976RSG1_9LACO|nr:sigma-70 family RNA polymerase sigma factor [Nicoliella spurrieriana]UQS87018.1 sigma-70 family RNA polymerase sigma factor [Nicoliella spurrieriana]
MTIINHDHINQETQLIQAIQSGDESAIKALFSKYRPVVNKIWRQYFINGMEIDDWNQEALIVLVRIIDQYDCERGVSFGSFYRQALKNRFFDLIRRKNAQKRMPDKMLSSFDAFESFYSDTLVDFSSFCPEKRILQNEQIELILSRLSFLERSILIETFRNASLKEIATKYHCSENKVVNAFERCKRKFNNYRKQMNG